VPDHAVVFAYLVVLMNTLLLTDPDKIMLVTLWVFMITEAYASSTESKSLYLQGIESELFSMISTVCFDPYTRATPAFYRGCDEVHRSNRASIDILGAAPGAHCNERYFINAQNVT